MARTRPPFATKPAFESMEQVARELRLEVIALSHQSKTVLPSTSLSCVELLIALYWTILRIDPTRPDDPNRDRFLFNKSDSISILYAVLARRGFFPSEELKQFNKEGCRLALQPAPHSVPGLEWSLNLPGQGLGVTVGMALAAHTLEQNYKIYIMIGDDFCANSVQESARIAAQLGLSNLTAIVETNKFARPSGKNPSVAQWKSFGWETREVDGHDTTAIGKILKEQRDEERPLALIASTNKGYGIGFASEDLWANRPPSEEEVETARKELTR
ncbi:MAG: hypothetical protein QM715_11725 [Nibricoccus sp.]